MARDLVHPAPDYSLLRLQDCLSVVSMDGKPSIENPDGGDGIEPAEGASRACGGFPGAVRVVGFRHEACQRRGLARGSRWEGPGSVEARTDTRRATFMPFEPDGVRGVVAALSFRSGNPDQPSEPGGG